MTRRAAAILALSLSGCSSWASSPSKAPPREAPTTPLASGEGTAPAGDSATDTLPPDAPRAPGQNALVGYRSTEGPRPGGAFDAVHFDVASLPLAKWGPPVKKSHGFTLTPLGKGTDGYRLWVRSPLYSEVVVSSSMSRASFSAFTGGSFGEGLPPDCGPDHLGRFPARWLGLDPRAWTDASVRVEMATGPLDVATCSAAPELAIDARAAAIVPGFVYAIRVEESWGEALHVFLPRGVLTAASASLASPLDAASSGAFTRFTFPVADTMGRAAVARLSPAALRLWAHMRTSLAPVWQYVDSTPTADDLLVEVDVVAQGERTLGTVTITAPRGGSSTYEKMLRAASG